MRYIRLLVKCWLIVACSPLLAGVPASAEEAAPFNGKPLVVVHSDNTPPLSFKGLDGSPKGVVVDFWNAWSAATGIDVSIVQANWPDTLQMMRDGTADVHGGLYFTDERDAFLDFSSPIFTQAVTLFVRSSLGIKTVAELGEREVAVLEQGYSAFWLARSHPELKQKPYKTSRAMVEAALACEVDAVLTEYTTLVYQLSATGQCSNFVPLAEMYERPVMGAVSQGRGDLLAIVEQGIRAVGTKKRQKLFERWIIREEGLPGWIWPAVGVGALALFVGLASVFAGGRRPE